MILCLFTGLTRWGSGRIAAPEYPLFGRSRPKKKDLGWTSSLQTTLKNANRVSSKLFGPAFHQHHRILPAEPEGVGDRHAHHPAGAPGSAHSRDRTRGRVRHS